MRHPHWARREIERLDPERDAARIARLLFGVRYRSPMFIHALFGVAFARQVAVPRIAAILDRDGRGTILHETAKRNDDTLLFFGLLFRHANRPEMGGVVERIVAMHRRYRIPNDLHLYTLSTLVCLPRRLGPQFLGRELLSARENAALYHFWRGVGEQMGIERIPGSPDAMLAWMLDFEDREYGPTEGGARVADALAREFAERWFPAPLEALGKRIFFATFDDRLRAIHRAPEPTAIERRLVSAAVASFLASRRLLPDPREVDLVELFGGRYGGAAALAELGPSSSADTAPDAARPRGRAKASGIGSPRSPSGVDHLSRSSLRRSPLTAK